VPTSGLYPNSADLFVSAMGRICKEEGLTLVWNSHNVSVLETIASSILNLDEVVL
jgi:ABC-type multidrug transport system ATPase subunit